MAKANPDPKPRKDDYAERWKARFAQLIGRKITDVHIMDQESADALGFHERPVVLELDDGSSLFPLRDDEGNGPGALSYLPAEGEQTFPVFPAERR